MRPAHSVKYLFFTIPYSVYTYVFFVVVKLKNVKNVTWTHVSLSLRMHFKQRTLKPRLEMNQTQTHIEMLDILLCVGVLIFKINANYVKYLKHFNYCFRCCIFYKLINSLVYGICYKSLRI